MFEKVQSLIAGAVDVAPPKDVQSFPMTENEAAVQGAAYKYASGRLTICDGTDSEIPAVIALESADGAADVGGAAAVRVRGSYIVPGAIYKVRPATANGTTRIGNSEDKHANVDVGSKIAPITNNGLYADWATDPGTPTVGPLSVLRMVEDDEGDSWLWVVFHRSLVS